jgi:ubiquinone biosynthesis monooxygenase Coq7
MRSHPSALTIFNVTARSLTIAASSVSSAYTDPSRLHEPAVATTPADLTQNQRYILDTALRVDQAGEVAANWIYKGQMAVLGRDHTAGPIIQVCQVHYTFIFNSPQRLL